MTEVRAVREGRPASFVYSSEPLDTTSGTFSKDATSGIASGITVQSSRSRPDLLSSIPFRFPSFEAPWHGQLALRSSGRIALACAYAWVSIRLQMEPCTGAVGMSPPFIAFFSRLAAAASTSQ